MMVKLPQEAQDKNMRMKKNRTLPVETNTMTENVKYGPITAICAINPSYMSKMCKKSCNKCESGAREDTNEDRRDPFVDPDKEQKDGSFDVDKTTKATIRTTTDDTPKQACQDTHSNCPSWAKSGVCNTNPTYALKACKFSCKNCKEVCTDQHTLCKLWSKSNHCNTNSAYMMRFCQKSCDVC
mmetsp:Transcript_32720/g.52201  ORF Transcript_32720/g.52201 Transcript_32720/m.52201 type:complete len:183 (+) Transcript_32720:1555-2103(+)